MILTFFLTGNYDINLYLRVARGNNSRGQLLLMNIERIEYSKRALLGSGSL